MPAIWLKVVNKRIKPGGSADKRLGKVKDFEIMAEPGTESPVHLSHYNREDRESVIAARGVGSKGSKACHIYKDDMNTSVKSPYGT